MESYLALPALATLHVLLYIYAARCKHLRNVCQRCRIHNLELSNLELGLSMGSSDLRLQSNGLTFLTLIQVSRPGFYHISVALYLCGAASDPWALLSCRAILGLLFVVFPLNLIVYGMNDLRDVDIDKYNARKGGIYGAQASIGYITLDLLCHACRFSTCSLLSDTY